MLDNWVVQNLENALGTWNTKLVFIAQYNYQKLQSEMENIASPKWRKLQRIF